MAIEKFVGHQVKVVCDDCQYEGILLEVDNQEIILVDDEMGYVCIPRSKFLEATLLDSP